MVGLDIKSKTLAVVAAFSLIVMGTTAITGCLEEDEEVTELEIAMTDEPGRFGPIEQEDVYSNYVFDNIFDPMISFYPDGEPDTEGTILEDYEVSEDGLTYTWEIRDDAYFHHGEPVTAEDVRFTFHAHAGDAHEHYDVEEGDIPTSPSQDDAQQVEEIEIVDDNTIKFHLEAVNSEFLHGRLMSTMWALPHEWIEENSYEEFTDDNFIGHGPFEFVEYSPGHEIILEKNEEYHGEEQADVDRVIFEVFDDESSAVAALRAGRIHYIPSTEATTFFDLQEEDDIEAVAEPSFGHQLLSFNHERDVWQDVKVRRALAYALDFEEIIETARTDELAYNVRTPVHPEHPDHLEDHKLYERDLDKAQELLEEAGMPDGPERELRGIVTVGEREDEFVVIQDQAAEVGFDIEIAALEFGTVVEEMHAGNFDLVLIGWTPTASAEYAMTYYRPGSEFAFATGYWETEWSYKLEENLTEAERSFGEERRGYYHNAQEIIVQRLPNIILYGRADPAAHHETFEIEDEAWNPFSGPVTNLHRVEIDE